MSNNLFPLPVVLLGTVLLLAACEVDTADTATNGVDTVAVSDAHLGDLQTDIRERLDTAAADIDRLEQRAETADENRRDGILRSTEDFRQEHQDIEERFAEADLDEDTHARLDSYESIQSDAAALQRRVERSILEHADDADTLAEDTNNFLARVDGRMTHAEGDGLTNLQEQRQDIDQKLEELAGASQERFEELREDIASDYADLRRDADDAYLDHAHDRDARL